jgi:EAL domain-containing protein (putative c-di-GMP-specific phosphodiesterase class I)
MVSVNLSARQIADPGLPGDVAAVLAETGLRPASLVLELIESVLLADEHISALTELRALGVLLALDDFGTGWSSLDRLRQMRPDILKIDGRFVAALEDGLARGILQLAAALGIATVAEGVENPAQLAHLRALDCDLGQGDLFAPPLDPQAFEAALATEVRRAAPRQALPR